jgi:predicted lipid-binding transport protein (Tim44 family)
MARPGPAFFGLVAIVALLLISAIAWARPGGGHGYSGPSGGSGGGGDGDGLVMIFLFLLRLCIECPVVGIPLMILFLGFLVVSTLIKMRRRSYGDWESTTSAKTRGAAPMPLAVAPAAGAGTNVRPMGNDSSVYRSLQSIRRVDPNFSTVLFEDFLYALFAEVHRSRGGNRLGRVSAYLMQEAMTALSRRQAFEVDSVIVGAMRIVHVSGIGPQDAMVVVAVEFEANVTERAQAGIAPQGRYLMERWTLVRKHGPQSRVPAQAIVLACPSCGAPLDVVVAGHCSHCRQQVNSGAFDWTVRSIDLIRAEYRGPMLTTNVAEQGTQLPTVFDPSLQQASAALTSRDPQFQWEGFRARIQLIFNEFQKAWSARDLASMRPYLSDSLFQTQVYWVEAYRQQGLRNITERARIAGLEIVKIDADRFFDSITVRLWATGLDYTVTEDGQRVVSGSKSRERPYSEYWTFIRGTGRSAPTRTDKACPNCGAPLQINMAGVCEYCKAKVTTGQFDWVLSKIEQDEAYRG